MVRDTSFRVFFVVFFFFNDTATTEIYTLSLHDALPIGGPAMLCRSCPAPGTTQPAWPTRISGAILAPIGRYLSCQAAEPHGPIGRLLARIWIRETAAVNDTALDLLAPAPGERILEIGFGPGRTLTRLAAASTDVIGVEIAPTMLAAAARRNAAHIVTGRMHLHHGDGTTLPVEDRSLDAVIGVHTIYFWPDPPPPPSPT